MLESFSPNVYEITQNSRLAVDIALLVISVIRVFIGNAKQWIRAVQPPSEQNRLNMSSKTDSEW